MIENISYLPNHMDSIYNVDGHELYIGNYDSAINKEILQQSNIKTIITMSKSLPISYSGCEFIIRHKVYMAIDEPNYNISRHFNDSFAIINKGLQQGSVLVHCAAGISRSATIVIAYLMKKNQWSYMNAYKYVKSKRKIIKPNPGFQIQLRKFQHHLSNFNIQTLPTQRKSLKSLVLLRRKGAKSTCNSKLSFQKSTQSHQITSNFRISKRKPLRA